VLAFIVRRLFWAVLLVFVITWITFVIFILLPEERRSAPSGVGLVNPNLQRQFELEERSLPGKYVGFF
jgi:ABC-type dipeptide/oligopeptide/nickel transport system permease component